MNRVLILTVCGALALAGCASRLDSRHTFHLPDAGDTDKLIQPPTQKSAQSVKIEVTASEPVDVYVIPTKAADDPRDLSAADRAAKSLGSKQGVTKDTLTAQVPANEAYQVLVALGKNSKKADVTLRLTN